MTQCRTFLIVHEMEYKHHFQNQVFTVHEHAPIVPLPWVALRIQSDMKCASSMQIIVHANIPHTQVPTNKKWLKMTHFWVGNFTSKQHNLSPEQIKISKQIREDRRNFFFQTGRKSSAPRYTSYIVEDGDNNQEFLTSEKVSCEFWWGIYLRKFRGKKKTRAALFFFLRNFERNPKQNKQLTHFWCQKSLVVIIWRSVFLVVFFGI